MFELLFFLLRRLNRHFTWTRIPKPNKIGRRLNFMGSLLYLYFYAYIWYSPILLYIVLLIKKKIKIKVYFTVKSGFLHCVNEYQEFEGFLGLLLKNFLKIKLVSVFYFLFCASGTWKFEHFLLFYSFSNTIIRATERLTLL